MCVFRKMRTLMRLVWCRPIVFVLILLVSEGQMRPQNTGSSNLRPSPIYDNKLPIENTVPLSPRPSPARAPPRRPETEEALRGADGSWQVRPQPRDDKKPDKMAPTRPTPSGRSQDVLGYSGVVDLISTTMQIAQEARRSEPNPRPNWNQGIRPNRPQPSFSEPGARGNNVTFPKRTSKPTNGRPDIGTPIVFPNTQRFMPSESCVKSGRTFCETRSDYPTEHIAKVLDSTLASRFGSLFGADEVEVSNITQRFDLQPDDETLCQSVEKVIYPTAGQTKDNQWRFIVNQEKFLQGVRIEMCMEEDGKCTFSDSFPFGYHSFCKQKYIYRKLVSVTADGTSTTDEFKLPSCCSCHIRVDTAMRMASDVTPISDRNKRRLGRHHGL